MTEWEAPKYYFPELAESNYGMKFPPGTNQVVKELWGFRDNGRTSPLSRFEHAINLCRILWPESVKLSHRLDCGEVIWNHFFIEAIRDLCAFDRIAFTGCASSGKTFAVAVYCVLSFMSNPRSTTIMVSSTAASDAERRIWGEIKDLHRSAVIDAGDGSKFQIGTLVDYLNVITFDPSLEISGKRDIKERDIRNGIMLIPIPEGREGEGALRKIIGTKNTFVIWVVDELPHMIDGIFAPEANLASNINYQFVGIGNANKKHDPHGRLCEPREGWDSVSPAMDSWDGLAGCRVRLFHGRRSPNFHPLIPSHDRAGEYPFPYLANPVSLRKIAELEGGGNIALGEKTIGFSRFGIGFWSGDEVSDRIISDAQVKQMRADTTDHSWAASGYEVIAGFDCGFTSGGDSNELSIFRLGVDHLGRQLLECPNETIVIRGVGDDRESYRKSVASELVSECKKAGVRPSNFFMDINADGGLMMQAIQAAWETHEIVGLSSLEPPDEEYRAKYDNRVTQYWYSVSVAVNTGRMRGFNVRSGYADDLFSRPYESVGKGRVRVEKKSEMKRRIKRSPDKGDSFCYGLHGAIRRGFSLSQSTEAQEVDYSGMGERIASMFGAGDRGGEDEYSPGHTADDGDEGDVTYVSYYFSDA